MKQEYVLDPIKFGVSCATVSICVLLAAFLFLRGERAGLFFLLPALPFVYVASVYGSRLIVSPEGLILSRPWKKEAVSLPWSSVKEMGVVGTKVFNHGNADKTGSLYIYFSEKSLTEDERFRTALEWPPKDMLFLLYTKERMDAIRPLWTGKVQAYNTGELKNF